MIAVVADSTQKENLRIRLDGPVKRRWDELLRRKRISQQDAVEGLVLFLLEQDDAGQSLALGQITDPKDRAAIAAVLLARMATDAAVPNAEGKRFATEIEGGKVVSRRELQAPADDAASQRSARAPARSSTKAR